MIKATHLIKSYNNGTIKALNDVSLEIKDQSLVVILGASGSGKSTLLNILSGIEKCDAGEIFYDDMNIANLSEKELTEFRRKNIGFIFQQYYLIPHLSVVQNVKMGADLVQNKDYLKIIESVGLKEKLKQKPSELSGGEQQRVSIARALAKNPHVLFLDEPTGALDEATGREILDYLSKLQKEQKMTMIMVTHNQNIAQMADVIITMNSGKLVKVTTNKHKLSAYEIGW